MVVPDSIDDPLRPSGGNVYDREVCRALAAAGWTVHEHAVPGEWPHPDDPARHRLAAVLDAVPAGARVLVDGLIGSAASEVLVPRAPRLRLVLLVHMPLGAASEAARPAERAVLCAARGVVTTSRWTGRLLQQLYRLPAERTYVAEPGVHPAELAAGSDSGGELLCVAALWPGKGHDVLVDALAATTDLPWRCTCVGSLDVDREFADRVRAQVRRGGLADRVRFTGPLTGGELDAAYAAADLLVLPSRAETYGLVLVEALARGIPVLATAVGGVPEALRGPADAQLPGLPGLPGLLVPAEDADQLAAALRRWLDDPALRCRLRQAARDRRHGLTDWSRTAALLGEALMAADPGSGFP